MNKEQLLDFEKSAHLSIAELRRTRPELAKQVDGRLGTFAADEVLARMQTVSEKLRGFTSSVGIELSANLKRTQFRIQFLKALREGVAKDGALLGDLAISQELDELEKSGLAAVGDDSISDASRPNEPLAFHPAFRREIDAARVYRFSDAAGLEDQISEVLIKEVGSISNINEHKLDTLLQARKLGDSDARRVGVAATLFNVLDERTELLKAVSATVQNPESS